jgi:RNA polymerase sigma-70 factor (ECF subfamily)
LDLETTAELLSRVRGGDEAARERLVSRYLRILKRWAHGRLPSYARDLADTDDLVQVTLLRALDRIGEFQPQREGAFLAYLRQILLNSVRDEVRRAGRRGVREELTEETAGASAGAGAVSPEEMIAYEAALAKLPEVQKEAVILRVEFGFSYAEIAASTGSPSANAARMMVTRALVRLAGEMEGSAG